MKAVIGMDFGTQSARAILVNAETGAVLCSSTVIYPHGIWDGGLADAGDYENALYQLLEAVTPPEYRSAVAGICVDATSLTLVCLDDAGRPLSQIPGLEDRHHAQVKLWKYHKAQPWADRATDLAKEMGQPFLGRTGGSVSCQWTLPKLLQIRAEDPQCYEKIDLALDLTEFLTCRLTGTLSRSQSSVSFKGLWFEDLGFPSEGYLEALGAGFAREYKHFLRGPVGKPGRAVGYLRPELCQKLGLPARTAVAMGIIDGHAPIPSLGTLEAGQMALSVGTSNVAMVQTATLREAEGICGIVLNGATEGLYSISTGQSCTGDMLNWFMENLLPHSYYMEAKEKGISPHQLLTEKVSQPWKNQLVILDWWNGSRNFPCDLEKRGAISGLSLDTRPKDIYLAMLQSIACGTRDLIENLEQAGVPVTEVRATGGITGKNPLLMQQYADLLQRPIHVGQTPEGPALGSAIYAAVAAGLYPDVKAAWGHMGVRDFVTYYPDEVHRAEYEALYQANRALRAKNM